MLLLARLCKALDATALPAAVEGAAAAFAGAGGGLGADQPPAFVAAQVSRCADQVLGEVLGQGQGPGSGPNPKPAVSRDSSYGFYYGPTR